jgi:hypothetical protein
MLRNLNKILDQYEQQLGSTNTEQLELLKGLPFYSDWSDATATHKIGSRQINSQKIVIDFNHAIGLPQKNGVAFPLFDYEQMLFDLLLTMLVIAINNICLSQAD